MSNKGYFRYLSDRARYSGKYSRLPKDAQQFFVFKDGKLLETIMGKKGDLESVTAQMVEKYGPDILVS